VNPLTRKQQVKFSASTPIAINADHWRQICVLSLATVALEKPFLKDSSAILLQPPFCRIAQGKENDLVLKKEFRQASTPALVTIFETVEHHFGKKCKANGNSQLTVLVDRD